MRLNGRVETGTDNATSEENVMKRLASLMVAAGAAAFVVAGSGCAMFRASTTTVDVNQEIHMKEKFDYSDLRKLTEEIATEIDGFLDQHQPAPIFVVAGVENRTSDYVDTKNLTDRVRTLMFKSGKAQFVNESRREDLLKEQGFQAANATPETQAAIGRQLGAKYLLSGSLVEMKTTSPRQVRISKQKLNYYKLTFEVTDLESGLLAWTTEKEFARQASQPLIGW
jgi:uncharacterized protein (TIGR02722 family)